MKIFHYNVGIDDTWNERGDDASVSLGVWQNIHPSMNIKLLSFWDFWFHDFPEVTSLLSSYYSVYWKQLKVNILFCGFYTLIWNLKYVEESLSKSNFVYGEIMVPQEDRSMWQYLYLYQITYTSL
jgi:hypothetical protein